MHRDMITRFMLDDYSRDEDPDGEYVLAADIDHVLRDLQDVALYLKRKMKVPLANAILHKYAEEFKRL